MNDVRTRLVNAAGKFFAERGFEGTSVRDITAEAQCNVAAVNYHFGSKEKLYEAAFSHLAGELRTWREKRLRADLQAARRGGSLEKLLRSFVIAFLEEFENEERRSRLEAFIDMEIRNQHLPPETFFGELVQPVQQLALQILQQAGPPMDDRAAGFCVETLMGMLMHARRGRTLAVRHGIPALYHDATREELVDHIVSFVVGGIHASAKSSRGRAKRAASTSRQTTQGGGAMKSIGREAKGAPPARRAIAVAGNGLLAAVVLAGVFALTGCVAGRTRAAKPNVELPPSWSSSGTGMATTSPEDLSKWWEVFGDKTLSGLTEQALINNPDVRTAQSRLRAARAQRNLAAANRFPTATVSGADSGSKTSGSSATNQLSAAIDASWEPDVFGAKRKALEAADADAKATEADLHLTQVSLAAEVALNYVELRSYQSRVEIARRNTASQAETLQLTEWREQAGLASSVDVEQARTNLEQTRASIPLLEASIAANEHGLATLLGLTPGALKSQLEPAAPVPSVPDTVAVGIPADTLRQRPDVHAAEQTVIAETARLRQAEAGRYPSFSLGGSLGLEKVTGGALGTVTGGTLAAATGGITKIASFSGSAIQTIFDRGRLRAQIEIQNAVQEQAVISYESTVLAALEDVENALVSLAKNRERLAALDSAGASARNAALLARSRYAVGLIDFTTVLDTERTVLTVEDSIAQTQADRVTALIQLYKALGGGWSPAGTGTP